MIEARSKMGKQFKQFLQSCAVQKIGLQLFVGSDRDGSREFIEKRNLAADLPCVNHDFFLLRWNLHGCRPAKQDVDAMIGLTFPDQDLSRLPLLSYRFVRNQGPVIGS